MRVSAAELWNKIQRVLLPNEVQRNQLKRGDHIYTWRQANTKHHGIYVGYGKVIHLIRAAAHSNHRICPTCDVNRQPRALDVDGVVSTSLDDFISGADLFLFKYGVNPALFLGKLKGTCTLASCDASQVVVDRAYNFLLNNGSASGDYYRYISSGEDFAIYCKTGLLVIDSIDFSRILQTSFFLAATAAFVYFDQKLVLATFTGMLGSYVGIYSICRYAPDIGARPNVIKVDRVQRLPGVDNILASGADWQIQRELQDLIDRYFLKLLGASLICTLLGMGFETIGVLSEKMVWILAGVIFFYWTVLQRRLLSNKIQKEQLKPGDHIFTYRHAYTYAHHGIYVGEGQMIHLDREEEDPIRQNNVNRCCINRFLDGGELYLYKYGVSMAYFVAKTRGGTCTQASANPTEDVVRRAHFLLQHTEFGAYSLFGNDCEDFAMYCKTGLYSKTALSPGKNGQIASFVAICMAICMAFLLLNAFIIPTRNYIDVAARVYLTSSFFRYKIDKREYVRVPVQELAAVRQTRASNSLIFIVGWFLIVGFVGIIIIILRAMIWCFEKLS